MQRPLDNLVKGRRVGHRRDGRAGAEQGGEPVSGGWARTPAAPPSLLSLPPQGPGRRVPTLERMWVL